MKVKAFCEYPFNRVRVTCEGDIAMCCFQRVNQLEDAHQPIGNVLKQKFDEIWFGELAEEIRQETMRGRLHKNCQVSGCPYLSDRKMREIHYGEYPTFLEIDLPNTHCNIGLEDPTNPKHPACIMCERAHPEFKPQKNLLKQVLSRLTHLMPSLSQIHIQGIAEPFWKGLIWEILEDLQFDKYRHTLVISTTTNGLLLKEKTSDKFLREVPHSIVTFSLDAATAETYRKIRIIDGFDLVLKNLNAYSRARCRSRQFLKIHNNINTLNVKEVKGMCQIAADANVEFVEFNPTDGFHKEILVNGKNCGSFRKAHLDIISECERLNVPYKFFRPLDLGMTDQLVQITL